MDPVTIIGTPISHYVQTVVLCCEEKGIPYRLQIEGHDTPAALKTPAHRRWHPFGKIPALQHGAVVLYESAAICRYLDAAFDGPALTPADALAQARMEQWISVTHSYLHGPCISRLVSHYVFPRGPDCEPDRAVIAAALDEVDQSLCVLAATVDDHAYAAGSTLSLADLFITPLLLQLRQTPEGQAVLNRYPALIAYLARLEPRQSVQRMQAQHLRHLPKGHRLLIA